MLMMSFDDYADDDVALRLVVIFSDDVADDGL